MANNILKIQAKSRGINVRVFYKKAIAEVQRHQEIIGLKFFFVLSSKHLHAPVKVWTIWNRIIKILHLRNDQNPENILDVTNLPTVSFGVILNVFDELCHALSRIAEVLRKSTVGEVNQADLSITSGEENWNQEKQRLVAHSGHTERLSI